MAGYALLAARARRGTLVALPLMLLIVAANTMIAPTEGRSPNWVVWLALSLPLLVLVPGLLRGGIYSFVWLSFISLLYFAQAVTALMMPHARLLDGMHLLVSVALFVGGLLYVRWRARADRGAS